MTATENKTGTVDGNFSLVKACEEFGLTGPAVNLPSSREVRRGKGHVTVTGFNQAGKGAAEIKADLIKANPKMKSKAVAAAVREALRGEKPLREIMAVAWVQSRFQAGDVASQGEVTKSGSCLRMVHAPEPTVAAAVIPQGKDEIKAELAKLQARLAELEAATPTA